MQAMPKCSYKNRKYAKELKNKNLSETLAMQLLMNGQQSLFGGSVAYGGEMSTMMDLNDTLSAGRAGALSISGKKT